MEPHISTESEPVSGRTGADRASIQSQLVEALRGLQELEAELDEASWCAPAISLIQMALGIVSKGNASEDPMELSPERLASFALLLRERRAASGLTQDELARLAGISKRTVYNMETGKQAPSRETVGRLLGVAQLGLFVSDFNDSGEQSEDPAWEPNSWFAPRYDPAQLMQDMVALLNGPGGSLEQTYLYLDGKSATDYFDLCNSAQVFLAFRDAAPLEQVGALIAKEAGALALDVNALGSGAAQNEVRLVRAIAEQRPTPPDLRLRLLDISHTLLGCAYKHAKARLQGSGIEVLTLHANFHDLARCRLLHANSGRRRRRLYTLLGATMANLDNEVRFFQELAHCASSDDLCLLDFQLAVAPAERPDEIRRLDPPLVHGVAPTHVPWLSGPIERHCRGAVGVKLTMDLTTACPVPGSYELDCTATVQMRDGSQRRFLVWRGKRYDPDRLAECLETLGWKAVTTLRYGVGAEKTAAVMLLRRK